MRVCGACFAVVRPRALRCDLCGAHFEGPKKVPRLVSFVDYSQGAEIDTQTDELENTLTIGISMKIGFRPEGCPR